MYVMAEVQTLADRLFDGNPRLLEDFVVAKWPSR
jgi:hypothetical protein